MRLRLRQGQQRRGVFVSEARAHRFWQQQCRSLHAFVPRVERRGAYGRCLNSGAVSNQVNDVANAEVVLIIGANPTSNHPVAATWIKNAG